MSQNVEAVVLALYQLGGHSRPIDTEDVAMRAHALAPDRFSWKKYPDQINLELVRVSLSDGKKASGGKWVEGSGREGWRLTPAGGQWAAGQPATSGKTFGRPREAAKGGGIAERRWRAERQRVLGTAAWAAWSAGQTITEGDALDLFRIDVYTVGTLRATKITRLVAQFAGDPDLSSFLQAAEAALPQM